MAKFDVTVYTETTFEIEAESREAAKENAIRAAELHGGNYYDWCVEDEDVELIEE